MRIIAVMSPKGGIGKTTTSDAIAYMLGEEQEKRVLILDGDPQGDTSKTYIIGMDARKNIEFSNATAMCLKNKYIQYVCKLEKMNKAILLSEKQKTNLHWDEKITCESNLELYRELTEKHLHSIYQRHPRSIGKCLADGEGAFKLLDIEEQVKIICDIVQYTSFQRGVFSLKVLGGPKEVGRIRISGNMTEAKECKLVNYSITGMYKTEMDLLKK